MFCWGRAWQLSVLNFKKEGSEKKRVLEGFPAMDIYLPGEWGELTTSMFLVKKKHVNLLLNFLLNYVQ